MARVTTIDTDDIDDTTTKPTHVMRAEAGDDLPFSFDDFSFDLEEIPMDDASVAHPRDVDDKGVPVKTYPYVGASVWLTPFPAPAKLVQGGMAIQGRSGEQATALPLIYEGIAECIPGHTMVNPKTQKYYPQFWGNPDAVGELPFETLYDLISIIQTGELADTRKKGSSSGRAGTTIRPSSGRRTRR